MADHLAKRAQMENELRRALKCNEFRLYYQPQIHAETGVLEGVEALLRWQHPRLGLVSPAEFIPVLEESGLINPVGEWVLYEACNQAKVWMESGFPPLIMAVNLSGRQFNHGNLDEYVGKILKETALDPSCLELEITETILMESRNDTQATLRNIKKLGVKIAVDDFGTGYSSLSYIAGFDIDRLKIDRSFVTNLFENKNVAAIVQAVLAMAKAMDLKVTAEGVEKDAQARFLRDHGCDTLQGYLFNPPISPEQFVLAYQNKCDVLQMKNIATGGA